MDSNNGNSIPEGYKMTDLGLFPEEWELRRLENICNIQPGYPFNSSLFIDNPSNEAVPLIRIRDLVPRRTETFYKGQIEAEIFKTYLVNKGDILIGMDGNFHIVRWSSQKGLLNQRIARLQKFSADACGDYIFYASLKPLTIIEEEKHFTTVKHLSMHDLRTIIIPLPPLDEQKEIAAVLSAVQEAKEKTQAVIESAKKLKKSLMKYLFTYGPVPVSKADSITLKETEIGLMPADWCYSVVNEYCSILTGGTPKTEVKEYYYPEEIPWMKSGEIQGEVISKINTYISKKGLDNSNARILPKNSVVIALAGRGKTRGTTSILNIECACNQSVVCIIPNNQLSFIYLHYYLTNIYKYIRNITGDKDRGGLNLRLIGNINIFVPHLYVQHQIAEILSAVDKKIEVEENHKKALEELFKTLLHNLMTGKIRVNNLI